MKLTKLAIAGSIAVLLTACGGNETKEEQQAVALPVGDSCAFDNGQQGAPLWVCDYPVEGFPVKAVGRAAKSGAGMGYMRKQAALDARTALVEETRAKVKSGVDAFAGTTGSGDSETVDQVGNSMTSSISADMLVGSKIIRSTVGPDGELYMLIGMDEAATASTVQSVIKTSMNNEQALWQQFRKEKEFDKFNAEIEKSFGL